MDKINLVINKNILNQGMMPFIIITLVTLLIIIITIILVKRGLRGVKENEKN